MKIIDKDGAIVEATFEDELGKNALRHTASHILAQAVKRLYPDTKLAIGPWIENGFYYDFDRETPFTEADLEAIETEMKKIVKENLKLTRYTLPREDALKMMEEAGGVDLQLLGIGQDGHIGFNEPLSSLKSRTRDKSLTPLTLKQNGIYFDPPESMPRRAFTMGVGTILDARRIVMLVTGERKAEIVAKALEGPVSSMVTASAIQFHTNVAVILDEAAASKLAGKDYYNWSFNNEPCWEPYR